MTFCFKVHNHATLDLRFANLLRIKKVISTLFTRKVGFFEFGDKKRSKGIQALMGYLFKNLQYPVMSVKKLKNETSSKGQLSIEEMFKYLDQAKYNSGLFKKKALIEEAQVTGELFTFINNMGYMTDGQASALLKRFIWT